MDAREHAEYFLAPISPASSIRKFAKEVIRCAETDSEVASLLDALQNTLNSGESIIQDSHSEMFERLKCSAALPDIPTAPEWIRPAIAAAYLRARWAVGTSSRPFSADIKSGLKKALKLAQSVEPDFIGELLVETTLSAREDPQFSKQLHDGAAEFRQLVQETYGSIDPDTTQSTALAAAANPGGGGSGGSCRICRRTGGTQQCAPTSCWVIVVIIVIIIVTK